MNYHILNKEAELFYRELVLNKIIDKNEEMRDRLLEVENWKTAFSTILKHPGYFKIKIYNKEILINLLNKYQINITELSI